MNGRHIIAGALCALALFTATDHGLRKMQANECALGDVTPCPDKLWWFVAPAETDAELEALTGVHPLEGVYPDEFRLVGHGCEGAGDKPLFRNEEDEFPICKTIEAF